MTLDAIASHPVSIGAVPWPSGRLTIIVKLTFGLGLDGAFELASEGAAEPLLLDAFDAGGALLYPSDFAPYKPACDVVLVGADARDRQSAGHVAIGGVTRRVEAGEGLGPRESFGPLGDPLAAEALEQWSTGGVDVARFQSAPPASRVSFPQLPLLLDYARGDVRLRGVLRGPLPKVTVVAATGAAIAGPIPMLVDTLCLAPSLGRLVVVTRGLHDPVVGAPAARVVVDLGEHVAPAPAPGAWRILPIADPRRLRVDDEHAAVGADTRDPGDESTVAQPLRGGLAEGTRLGAAPCGPVLPFAARLPAAAPTEATRSHASVPAPGPALPFTARASEAPSRAELGAADVASLRATGRAAVAPAWQAAEGTTVAGTRLPPPLPPAPAAAAPAAPEPPARLSPAPAPPAPDAPAAIDRAAVQREIWKGERPLAEVLAAYGLTEATWRAMKRGSDRG